MSDVQHFKMGSDIPAWLLAIEPVNEASVMGQSRFGCDVDVLETDDYFLLLPTNILLPVSGILDFTGTYNCTAVATAKPVRILVSETVPFPRGMSPPMAGTPPYGLSIQPVVAAPLAPREPHRNFWSRLRYAFTGR